MLMFKKLRNKIFDEIVDLCNPVSDDPMCEFGVPPENSDEQSTLAAGDENSKKIRQKAKGFILDAA